MTPGKNERAQIEQTDMRRVRLFASLPIARLLIAAILGWCLYWWGVYVGEVGIAQTWLVSDRSDMHAVSLFLKGPVEAAEERKFLTSLLELQRVRVDMLEEVGRFSAAGFALYPLVGPYRRLTAHLQ